MSFIVFTDATGVAGTPAAQAGPQPHTHTPHSYEEGVLPMPKAWERDTGLVAQQAIALGGDDELLQMPRPKGWKSGGGDVAPVAPPPPAQLRAHEQVMPMPKAW